MKPFYYITIGILLTLTTIGFFAFKEAKSDLNNGTISITKELEPNDPACLQMFYYIEQYADSFDIPKKYAFGIANAETNYNGPFDWNYKPNLTSYCGAQGPMQIMPTTAAFINKEKVTGLKLKNDIKYNVKTSMKLLRYLHNQYGDWKLVFGAYNTGHPCVNAYANKVYKFDPEWIE